MGDETAIVKAYAEKADEIVSRAKSLVIHNQEERELVATVALEARFIDDEAEEREKEITKPLNEALKKVRQLFKDGVRIKCQAAQDGADELLKKDYLDFEDARKTSQDIINLQKPQDNSFVPDIVLPETERIIKTNIGKISMRKTIKVTVDDKPTVIRACSSYDCVCPKCGHEWHAGPTLPLIITDIDVQAAKRYFVSAGIKQAPGFTIKDDVTIVGSKK